MSHISRRDLFGVSAGLAATVCLDPNAIMAKSPTAVRGICLNTSTIRGQKIPIQDIVTMAGKAGYNGIEPWINELQDYRKKGGDLKDLGKKIADQGLKVESAIGFAKWIVDDDNVRKQGLDEAQRDMELVLAIGGQRIAAPPVGATDQANLNLHAVADRYRVLAELGAKIGIIPEVEVWGFSKSLSKLGETVLVAMESGHPKACVLPDIYHLFKGGSGFDGLKFLQGKSIGIFHVNDYPKDKDSKTIKDADRVYPGDGIAPLTAVFQTLNAIGYQGMVSLELFNPEYYKQDAFTVLKTGYDKTKAALLKAG